MVLPHETALNTELLIITGSMGAGKTAVMNEATDILNALNIPHAAIDLDALGIVCLPAENDDHGVMYRNLKCVWANYAALGIPRLLLARAVEDRAELSRIREAVSAGRVAICRLIADVGVMQERVRQRDPGMWQGRYVARVADLNTALDQAHLEDFSVRNENRSLTDVAKEVLVRAGWI